MKHYVFIGSLIASFAASVALVLIGMIFKINLEYYLTLIGTVVTALAFGFGTLERVACASHCATI